MPDGEDICNFLWDGEFIAVAHLYEDDAGDITIVPGNTTYADDWEYVPPRP